MAPGNHPPDVDRFIRDHVDTIPHLEALLLLWNDRPRCWTVDQTAERLFLTPESVQQIMFDLERQGLIVRSPELKTWAYQPDPERDTLIASLDLTYRKELIRISRLIHSKPSAAIRAFANAFRVKKERE